MAKTYGIKFEVDDSAATSALDRMTQAMSRSERAAQRAADAQQRSAEKAAAAQARASQRAADQQVRDAQRAADAKTRIDAKAADAVARATQRAAEAQARAAQRAADAQTRATQRAANAVVHSNDAIAASAGRTSASSVASFAKMAIGLGALKQIATEFVAAMQEADQKARKLTGNFTSARDKVAELATVMGEAPDDAFTLRNAEFNAATGFKDDEGLAFRMQFQNSGAQFKGSRIADKEYDQYEQQAGQLAAAKGFSPEQTGDLAGSLLGFADCRGMGEKASEHGLGKLNSGLAILGRGKGRNSVLVNQFSMLAASSLNEDAMKGSFTDSDDVATAIGVMAEKHDASATEMVKAAIKGLHDFDDEAGAMLQKAGIDAKTPYLEALKKLAPVVTAEAKARGVGVQDVLRSTFKDELTAEALATGINRGVEGGIIDDRVAFGRQNAGPDPALKQIDTYQKSGRGRQRQADSQLALAEARNGAQDADLAVLRTQAEAKLLRDGNIDTTWSNIQDTLPRVFSLGILPNNRDNRIDQEAALMLRSRLGDDKDGRLGVDLPTSPEGRSEYFARQIAKARGRNVDPFTGQPIQVPANAGAAPLALPLNDKAALGSAPAALGLPKMVAPDAGAAPIAARLGVGDPGMMALPNAAIDLNAKLMNAVMAPIGPPIGQGGSFLAGAPALPGGPGQAGGMTGQQADKMINLLGKLVDKDNRPKQPLQPLPIMGPRGLRDR